jgi:hypothetical protein
MLNEILSWCPVPRPGYIYLAQIGSVNLMRDGNDC